MEKKYDRNELKKEEVKNKIKKLLEDEGLNQDGEQKFSPNDEDSQLGLGCGVCCC